MKLFKLTDQYYTTYNRSMKWEVGKTNKVKKVKNPQLCSSDVIHAYINKNLALLLNPVPASISNFKMFECEGEVVVSNWNKVGVFSLTPKKEIKTPKWYLNEETRKKVQIQFAILCAENVLHFFEEKYPTDDGPRKAIGTAKECLKINNSDAARTAAYTAADAARAAADDAYTAADDAYTAAYTAADAARADIDFAKLADKAVKMITKGEII